MRKPLVFFWIAEFEDGKAIPQFRPENGEEILFKEVLERMKVVQLIRIGWYPFSHELAERVNSTGTPAFPSTLPTYRVPLDGEKRPIIKRVVELAGDSGTMKNEFYILGWQRTVDGRNEKDIITIDGKGNVEISEPA